MYVSSNKTLHQFIAINCVIIASLLLNHLFGSSSYLCIAWICFFPSYLYSSHSSISPLYLTSCIQSDCLHLMNCFSHLYSSCLQCQCNAAGSISSVVCDAVSGECHCKPNVEGMNCDTCKTGFQLLQQENPFGCSAGKLCKMQYFVMCNED